MESFGEALDLLQQWPDDDGIRRTMTTLCDTAYVDSPYYLLSKVRGEFVHQDGLANALFTEVDYDRAKLHRELIMLITDAMTLRAWHVTACLPFWNVTVATKKLTTAKVTTWIDEILNASYRLNDRMTQTFPSKKMKDVVAAVIKEKKDATKTEMATAAYNSLKSYD